MKVLIQDNQSKKYFTSSGEWASELREATDFESHRNAWIVAQQSKISEFNIMLYSKLGRYLFCVDNGKN